MPRTYDYIKLFGLIIFLSGVIKIVLGFFKYSFGKHYFSSLVIAGIGVFIYLLSLIIQKLTEVNEE